MDLSGSLLSVMLAGELANWRPSGKSCSLMPLPLGPPAQTPCLIYLCIYPLPPIPTQNLRTHQRFNMERGEKERKKGGEGERKRERKGNLCSVGINKALSN